MKGFLYFIPGVPVSQVTRERIESEGLGYLFDGRGAPGPQVVPGTADGVSGVVFSVPGKRGRGAPIPQRAGERAPDGKSLLVRWVKIHGSSASLGILDDARPGPSDLLRYEVVEGHDVELGDGAAWTVPVVRRLNGETNLPRALEWDGSDWRQGDVRPAYRKLWAAGLRMWDQIIGGAEGEPVTLTEETTTAAAALSLNYRLGPVEVSELGLFDTKSEVEVLKALIDLPALGALRGNVEAAAQ